MDNTDKQLLIKDLCARLPYGVIIRIMNESGSFNTDFDTNVIEVIRHCNDDIKPYLFPMSSMTEEQKNELYKVTIDGVLESDNIEGLEYKSIDWLNAHHFDYRGLLKRGLCIDATNLGIYD